MKRVYLILAMVIAAALPGAAHDGATGAIVLYNTSYQDCSVAAVSPNGKWACGNYIVSGTGGYGFLWNLETGVLEYITGDGGGQSYALDVSDDGVVAGSFYTGAYSSNGASIEVAGYWKDGSWHALEPSDGFSYSSGRAIGISADGLWIAGYAYSSSTGYRLPVVWKDGVMHKALLADNRANNDSRAYDITGDGALAAGLFYGGGSDSYAALWNVESGEMTYVGSTDYSGNMDIAFSPNGKYMSYFNSKSKNYQVYDLEGDSSVTVPDYYDFVYQCVYYCVDDSMRVYGYESNGYSDGYMLGLSATIAMPLSGTVVSFDDYMAERGVDLSDYPVGSVLAIYGCSADGNVLAVATSDSEGYEVPMVVMFGQNVTTREPAGLSATQVDGLMAARLTWSAPITNPTDLAGYNVYRDGERLNSALVTATSYTDAGLEAGDYTYAVSAVYDSGAESSLSTAATLTLSEREVSAPRSLIARQKGYNSAALTWTAPESNLVGKHYYDSEASLTSFGGGSYSFEVAIKYDADEMALYDGYTISHVTFVPLNEQTQWEVNIYDGTELVSSQVVTQELNYGVENTVTLDEPVAVSSLSGDLYCGVAVTVSTSSYDVIGVDHNSCKVGYSDLIRRFGEEWFYSMYETSAYSAYEISVPVGILLTPPDTDAEGIDDVARYNVYSDGALVGSSTTESYVEGGLADGTHAFAVEAEYADGRVSPQRTVSVDIAANESVFTSIDNVSLWGDGDEIAFSWKEPVDDDAQTVGYCEEDNFYQAIASSELNNWGYMARSVYPSSMFSGLSGYEITKLRFYVANDAAFTLYLYQGETLLFELPVDDYTVGAWNTVELDEPVAIVSGKTYTYDIDCFDGVETGGPLAMDGSPVVSGYANLYSLDGGETILTVYDDGSGNGNWMMDLVIADPDGGLLPVDGYAVRIDGETVTPSLISDNYYIHSFGSTADQSATHTVAVDVAYTGYGEVQGATNQFTLGAIADGIADAVTAEVRVYPNPATSYVVADGDGVEGLSAYSLGGVLMGTTTGNRLDVSSYAPGLYILKVNAGGKTQTVKLSVVR